MLRAAQGSLWRLIIDGQRTCLCHLNNPLIFNVRRIPTHILDIDPCNRNTMRDSKKCSGVTRNSSDLSLICKSILVLATSAYGTERPISIIKIFRYISFN